MDRTPPGDKLSTPDGWLEQHGDVLYRYAYLRLRNREAAEDAVQDTLLAALRGRQQFSGASAERTWLIGILKHKVSDYWRRAGRETPLDTDAEEQENLLDLLFDTTGHWRTAPSPWNDPDAALEQSQFWHVLSDCLAGLPPAHARAFSLCEIDGLEGSDACKVLDVAPTNLWVMLHRARLRLRQCLENRWFQRQPTNDA